MIQALSRHMTEYIFNNKMDKESFEIHQYGIEVIISTLINITLIVALGILFNQVVEAIIYILGFYIIRKFCGGYHCHTYAKCISLHVLLFYAYLLTSTCYKEVSLYINIASFIIFILYAPISRRDIISEQQVQYKKISLIILLGYIILANITPYKTIFTYINLIVSILIIACIEKHEKHIT